MDKKFLIIALIVAFVIGIGAVIFSYSQKYTYSLDFKENISTSEIYVTLSGTTVWIPDGGEQNTAETLFGLPSGTNFYNESDKKISAISFVIGKIKFKNEGVFTQVIEYPVLVAHVGLEHTSANLNISNVDYNFNVYPIYSMTDPLINLENYGIWSSGPGHVLPGQELDIYISLIRVPFYDDRETADIFKGGMISIEKMPPLKEYNPCSSGEYELPSLEEELARTVKTIPII